MKKQKKQKKKKKKNNHLRHALMYLRQGNLLGGKPVELLVKEAADAIDPDHLRAHTGLKGVGISIPAVRQAIMLLTDALQELSMGLAVHQVTLDKRRRLAKWNGEDNERNHG